MKTWKIIVGFSLLATATGCPGKDGQDTQPQVQDSDSGTDSGTDCTGTPGATDICDGIDNDCDGQIDEDPPTQTWYPDADSDGYGGPAEQIAACSLPTGYVETGGDCDDGNPFIFPGASEICDGLDNDCDGLTDDDDPSVTGQSAWYKDSDRDGSGAGPAFLFCAQPDGFVNNDADCNDNDNSIIHPTTWYRDADGDGYADAAGSTVSACDVPVGYAAVVGDCDDSNATVNPGETETCLDGVDNDCDGTDNGCDPLDGAVGASTDSAIVTGSSSNFGMYIGRSDLDGDGIPELLTSAPYGRSDLGVVYAFEGLDVGTTGGESLATTAVTGSVSYSYFGYDAISPGDLTGSGSNDLVALTSSEEVLVLQGRFDGTETADDAYARLTGLVSGSDITRRRMDGGDPDGDGTASLLIGDRYCSTYGSNAGAAWLVPGPIPKGSYAVSDLATTTFYSESDNAYLGVEVAMLGDVDGDGIDEVAVSAPYYSTFYNYGGAVLVESSDVTGKIAVNDASSGVAGEAKARYVGWSVANPGDTDGDGYSDLLLAAKADSTLTGRDTSAAYVFTGSLDIGLSGTSAASALIYSTESTSAFFAQRVGGAGDLDGDGMSDLTVSDYDNSTGGSTAGATFLYYGPISGTHASADAGIYGTASQYLGVNAEGVGDLNGDGYDDLAVGIYGPYQIAIFFGGSL